jgi:hypothetical protein
MPRELQGELETQEQTPTRAATEIAQLEEADFGEPEVRNALSALEPVWEELFPAELALTIARAHRWRELLDEGRFRGPSELARALGLSHAYVGRLLRLTLLAPDIIEAVLEGTEPSGLSIAMLAALPLDWEEQRGKIGQGG